MKKLAEATLIAKSNLPRAAAGFLVAPGLPALIFWLLVATTMRSSAAIVELALLFAAACYALSLLVGIPACRVLKRGRMRGIQPYLGAGAITGIAFVLAGFAAGFSIEELPSSDVWPLVCVALGTLPFAVAAGAGIGGAFWLIAVCPRGGERHGPDHGHAAARHGKHD